MGRTIAAIAERTTELGRILEVVGSAVGLVVEHLDREAGAPQERRGGYFCYGADMLADSSLLMHAKIGLVPSEKEDKCWDFSLEKMERLAVQPGDCSSWQTRDEAHDQYGGAIRAKGALFSFSGFSEHADEAAMLLAAVKLGVLAPHDSGNISSVSKNATFVAIMAALERAGCWDNGSWTVPLEEHE